MEDIVYLNGTLMPRSQAKVSAFDYAFLYGYGLFETMRAYGGSVFRLDSHLARLGQSARELGIAVNPGTLRKAVTDVLDANGLKDARVRLAVSIGEGSPVPDLLSCRTPTVLIVPAKYTPLSAEHYERGYRLNVSSIRRNSQSPVPAMKTANYMESLLARREAKAAGVDDVLLLNDRGYVAEASTSNVFLVSGNILQTPSKGSGILPGITRGVVLELAAQARIIAVEGDIRLEEMLAAGEAFLTNSVMEIMPITALNGTAIGGAGPGPVTRSLMKAYKELVLKETGH